MEKWIALLLVGASALLIVIGGSIAPAESAFDVAGLEVRSKGDVVKLGDMEAIVKEMDITPVVRNEFSERYDFDCFADEKLHQLRRQEKLDEVVAGGKSAFDKQVLLMDWAYKRIKLFGPPKSRPAGALDTLKAVDEGQAFNCTYYALLLRSALRSFGWVARGVGLKGAKGDGNGSEHGVVEVWSNQFRKWIVLDSTLSIYFEKAGVPLNAYEIRQEWFYNEGKDLTIVVGAARERHTKADLPIERGTHPGFGTLMLRPESIGKFLYIAYTPSTADGRPDYGKMFIIKDELCEGVPYHTRTNPKDPTREPYWPMQQAALKLTPADGTNISVQVDTFTPDFATYRHRIDGSNWADGAPVRWALHKGENTLEVVPVNKFSVEGVASKVVLELK